jgi:hypothetical protein
VTWSNAAQPVATSMAAPSSTRPAITHREFETTMDAAVDNNDDEAIAALVPAARELDGSDRSLANASVASRLRRSEALADEPYAALAAAVGAIGTEEGVQTLLHELDRVDLNARRHAMLVAALGQVQRSDGVRPLAARITADPLLLSETSRLAGEALTQIVDPSATQALLDWTQTTHDLVRGEQWLRRVRDSRSLALLRAAAQSPTTPRDLQDLLARVAHDLDAEYAPVP